MNLFPSGYRTFGSFPFPARPTMVAALAIAALAIAPMTALAAAGALCFAPTPYAVGLEPSSVALADMNGDGLNDMVIANHQASEEDRISVLINNGDGTFAESVFYGVGARPYWLAVGDVDGDGDTDVAVSNYFGDSVSVLLNDGAGTLAPHVEYATGSFPTFITLARLDADDDLDLAVANSNDNTGAVLMNNGDGTFGAPVAFPVGPVPYGVTAADFDLDGDVDLAFGNFDADGLGPTISVVHNNGDGTFASAVPYAVDPGAVGVAAGDLDNDGYCDLAVCSNAFTAGTSVSVLINNQDGTFAPYQAYAVDEGPYSLAIADLDGDGFRDIVSANETTGSLSILYNDGGGAFGPATSVPAGLITTDVAVGDLDGNGTPEVAATSYGTAEVWVLFNERAGVVLPPADAVVELGDAVLFEVVAGGPGPIAYQWRHDGVDLVDGPSGTGSTIAGATTDVLTITDVQLADAGAYDVLVANDCGGVVSAPAQLVVTFCPADIDGSGAVDFGDILVILATWGQTGVPADIDGSGTVDFGDLLVVLAAWGPC